jgi:hypothetical protein
MLPKFNVTGLVYIIRAEESRRVKIGYTSTEPIRRLAALQTGSPDRLSIVATVPGSMRLERSIHETLRASRSHGEWFSDTEEVRKFVDEVCALYPMWHETKRRRIRRSPAWATLPGDPAITQPKQRRASRATSIVRASVTLHGNQWRARCRLPDGTRPSVVLGPSTWSEEKARECCAALVEEGYFAALARESAKRVAPLPAGRVATVGECDSLEARVSRLTIEERLSNVLASARRSIRRWEPTPDDHKFILKCLEEGASLDDLHRSIEGARTWDEVIGMMGGIAHWATARAS